MDFSDRPFEYYPDWLSGLAADSLFHQLFESIPWATEYITLYGKTHEVPRKVAWFGPSYSYAGVHHPAKKIPEILNNVMNRLNAEFTFHFNAVLMNLYRNGNDSMGWHADNEPDLGLNPAIASLSLGQSRDFHIKHRSRTAEKYSIHLEHGSLLFMKPGMQSHYLHALPKRKKVTGARINLTFRKML